MTLRRCLVCMQQVEVYQPPATRCRAAKPHHYRGTECPGSYRPTGDLTTGAREDARTRRWLTGQRAGDMNDYLRQQGEIARDY